MQGSAICSLQRLLSAFGLHTILTWQGFLSIWHGEEAQSMYGQTEFQSKSIYLFPVMIAAPQTQLNNNNGKGTAVCCG